MVRKLLARFAAALVLVSPLANAAATGQLVSPTYVSVLGGESRTFSVRFFDALGHPAAGETVTWSNDACGWFPKGSFVQDTTTDATGLASIGFTALSPAGITCWLRADAGIALQFSVFTYQLWQVHFTTSVHPSPLTPGQPFGLAVQPRQAIYPLYEVDVSARVIPRTGNASVSPSSGHSGQSGLVDFAVTPSGTGMFDVELEHHGVTRRITFGLPANAWQDMWWSGQAENGWGMSVAQHGDMLFCVIYAYDDAGKPTWYVMPFGTWDAAHATFTGPLYHPAGSPYAAYDVARFAPGAAVGNATIGFANYDSASLDYSIGSASGHKSLSRQSFGTADPSTRGAYGDMWWGGAAQNGWGIALLQQGAAIFGVWFTYDEAGSPTWFVMPSGAWTDASTWEGHIYRTTGSPWVGRTYDASALRVTDAGTFRVRFNAGAATFDYTIDGHGGTLSLSRQSF